MKIIKIIHDCDLINDRPDVKEKIRDFDFIEFGKKFHKDIVNTAGILINKNKKEMGGFINNQKQKSTRMFSLPFIGRKLDELTVETILTATDLLSKDLRDRFIIESAMFHALKNIESFSEDIEFLSLSDAKQRYKKTPNITIGSYTLHPRDSSILTRLANFHKNLAMDKDDELVMLLGRMGAKKVEIINSSENRQTIDADVEASAPRTVNCSAGVSLTSETEKSQHLIVKFEGKKTEMADDLLKSSVWFSDDSKLNAIFESRRFSRNQILEYTLINNYSDSFDFDFDFAAKFLKTEVELRAEYQSISRQSRMFKVSFSED